MHFSGYIARRQRLIRFEIKLDRAMERRYFRGESPRLVTLRMPQRDLRIFRLDVFASCGDQVLCADEARYLLLRSQFGPTRAQAGFAAHLVVPKRSSQRAPRRDMAAILTAALLLSDSDQAFLHHRDHESAVFRKDLPARQPA